MRKLEETIRNFYKCVEEGKLLAAYSYIDSEMIFGGRHGLPLHQYINIMGNIQSYYGFINIESVIMEVHLGEKNSLYTNRDYAIGKVVWTDFIGRRKVFLEDWVRNGREVWENRNVIPQLG